MTEEMNSTTAESYTDGTNNTTTADHELIYIGVGGGGGALLLIIIVVVVVIVCLRRRRRKVREVAPPMPPLEDPPFEPEPSAKYQRRNSESDIESVRPVERRNDFQLQPSSANNPVSQQVNPEYYESSDDDDGSDKDYVNSPSSPDYENNPISIARAEAEAEMRLQQRRNGTPVSHLGQSHVLNPTPRHPVPSRQAYTMKPEAGVAVEGPPSPAKSPNSPPKVKCPSRGHTPSKPIAYINTSRSLEELDKRTVPLPPSMPSNSSLAKKKQPGPAPPPKSHPGKVAKGYVNHPTPK